MSKNKILAPYDLRSKYVHGSLENVDKELIKQSIFSDELCRKIIYEIISNQELHFLLGNNKKRIKQYFEDLKA
ncbi:hypothetical protein FJC62_24975 [Escherichia coli]|nr:hypothetical protein [Escherichia coli]